jgi:hypothetical protein
MQFSRLYTVCNKFKASQQNQLMAIGKLTLSIGGKPESIRIGVAGSLVVRASSQ